jgi:hypothetical protein
MREQSACVCVCVHVGTAAAVAARMLLSDTTASMQHTCKLSFFAPLFSLTSNPSP